MEPPDTTCKAADRDSHYRQRILAAANRLLVNNGIDSVNMYQIAQEAGIGQGTLYRRFSHLGEIYSELLRTSVEEFLKELEALAGAASNSSSALSQLEDLIRLSLDYIDRNAELLLAISSMYAGKKTFAPLKRPVMVRLRNLLLACLNRAKELGETREFDTLLTAHLLLSALSPFQYLYHLDELGCSKKRIYDGICNLFIDGLRAAPPSGQA